MQFFHNIGSISPSFWWISNYSSFDHKSCIFPYPIILCFRFIPVPTDTVPYSSRLQTRLVLQNPPPRAIFTGWKAKVLRMKQPPPRRPRLQRRWILTRTTRPMNHLQDLQDPWILKQSSSPTRISPSRSPFKTSFSILWRVSFSVFYFWFVLDVDLSLIMSGKRRDRFSIY